MIELAPHIRDAIESAPPLTAEQMATITSLMRAAEASRAQDRRKQNPDRSRTDVA